MTNMFRELKCQKQSICLTQGHKKCAEDKSKYSNVLLNLQTFYV